MGRISILFFLLIFCVSLANSQCPDLSNNTTVDGSNNTSIEMCGAMSALFEVNDPNLPSGTIEWFSSTTSGFDPLTAGTPVGASPIDSANPCDLGGCPNLEAIYINACGPGPENLNEFVVISSGAGFAIDDLSFEFDPVNTGGAGGNKNINTGEGCVWFPGEAALFTGCSSVISVTSGDYIPANSLLIMQASRYSTSSYDISALCGLSECIYVVSNSCDRQSPAFKNYESGNNSTRTNLISLACGCSDAVTYTVNDPNFAALPGLDGSYVLGDGITFGNEGCNNGPNITSISEYSFGAVTDDFVLNFTEAECNTTQYVVGVLNSSQNNTQCCPVEAQMTEEFEFDISCITAELQGVADLCPGECAEITVLISGGVPPYNLNLSFLGLPIPFDNIMIPFAGFPIDEKITICFDNGGPLIDPGTFTLDIPDVAAGGSGSLTLNAISDASGCTGTINGSSISVMFNDDPDIFDPGEQEACDIGDGTGIFTLSNLTTTINGGTAAMVNYYSDMAGTMPISDPYISSGGPIYAQVAGNPCDSEIIEIDLVIIDNGDAGLVTIFCTDSDGTPLSECTICDNDGVLGEEINLTILFENPSLNYDYEVIWTAESGPTSSIQGSGIGNSTVTFTIVETTTFFISVVTPDGDCPDMTDLGDVITMNYSIQPDLDEPQDLSDCGSVALPSITGNDIPVNAAYFGDPGGMGTMYNPGDIISNDSTLYLYAGIDGCDVEYEFDITIEDEAMIDEPNDVINCGGYSLPEITGTNVENAAYYTEIDGGGNMVAVGTIISTSTLLYLFDANCGGNQPTLEITITPGPIIENNTDTVVCEMYIVEPIIGIDLSGNEMYFDTTDGNGLIINVGDTLTQDSIIFIYDNSIGCEIQVPIFIDIKEPGYPGLDTAIVLCQGDPTLININEELGGELPDITGTWMDINNTGIVADSSQVDFSSLPSGTYLYEYQIRDSICVDTHSILTVNIIETPNAGNDASLTLCGDTTGIDVFALLGNPDISGTFFDESNMVAAFDPSNASFDASTTGTTLFTYVVGSPGSSCGVDSSTFTVIVEGSVSAGDDDNISVCAGITIDLTTQLNNNSSIGIFSETTPSGGLMGTTFDTKEVVGGSYVIMHIVSGMGACSSDTALLTLTVMDGANAGDGDDIQLCGETSISLSDYINGDPGGDFYFNNTMLPSGDITFANETGIIEYLYIVGDGLECPFDTATFTVTRNIKPETFLDITLENLCNEDCTTISFNAANNGGQSLTMYYHIESKMGEVDNRTQDIGDLMPNVEITFCIGTGGLSNNELQSGTEYTFILDSIAVDNPECVFTDGQSVTFNTNISVTNTLTGTYCTSDTIEVGNDIYHEGNTMGITIIEGSANECDTIVNVDLIFSDVAEGVFMETACEGDTVTLPLNGMIYTETNTIDEFLLPNGSINGCDSLVKVNIIFAGTTIGSYSETICAGDTILINEEEFFEGKVSGSQLLEGTNSMGCDSIVQVTIGIDNPVTYNLTGDFCQNYSRVVKNTTYDQSLPSGIEIFENEAANGCDSIVIIALTFNQEAVDSMFRFSTCDETYSIQIGNRVFDNTDTIGMVNLPASTPDACDTLVDVELSFGVLDITYMEVDGGCEVSDSGLVIIKSATGDAPFNIKYDGVNLIAYVLPIEIKLPIGTGEILVVDDNGCETTIAYELFSGGENFTIDENLGQLNVSGGLIDSIVWSPADGLTCTDCVDPLATPSQTTTYFATIFFDDSCSVELSIDVIVVDNTPDYILPSVFSPNGDNANDNFLLTITNGAIGIPQNMVIYDRWGNRVFSAIGEDLVTKGWDGTMGGRDVVAGVYVYQLTILENEKVVSIYGDVTVVR